MLVRKETTGRWKTIYYTDKEGVIKRKNCRDCQETKNMDEFYVTKYGGLGGRRPTCKECELYANREYQKEHVKEITQRRIAWRNRNPERDSDTQKRHLSRNRDKLNERRKMYPTNINRAAREFGLPAEFTVEDKEFLLEIFGGCALSGETDNIHFDHVIPLTTGVGGTVSWNIVPLKAGLNISKGNKNVFEWFRDNKRRFKLCEEKFNRMINYLASEKGVSREEYEKFVYEVFNYKGED